MKRNKKISAAMRNKMNKVNNIIKWDKLSINN